MVANKLVVVLETGWGNIKRIKICTLLSQKEGRCNIQYCDFLY